MPWPLINTKLSMASSEPAAKRSKTTPLLASPAQLTAATGVVGDYFADDIIGPFPQPA